MSKKNFVVLGLTINFVVCIIIAVLYFSDIGIVKKAVDTTQNTEDVLEKDSTTEGTATDTTGNTTENTTESTAEGTATENTTESTTEDTTESTTEDTTENTTEDTAESTAEDTAESTAEDTTTDTTPAGQLTESEEPTESMESIPAYVVGKNGVEIQSSCNVRSQPEVDAEVLGTARAGERYILIAEKCDEHWLAISYQGTIGYMSNNYGTLLP